MLTCKFVSCLSVHKSSNSSSMQDLSTAPSVLNIDFSSLANHLSFVHYNVQSLAPKLRDTLAAELMDFDILAFSETWLNESTLSEDLLIESFSQPQRKDRVGVIIYVQIHFSIGAVTTCNFEESRIFG